MQSEYLIDSSRPHITIQRETDIGQDRPLYVRQWDKKVFLEHALSLLNQRNVFVLPVNF